jgi:hypothetical protein
LYAYSWITKNKIDFKPSDEGFTYIKESTVTRATKKVHDFIYGDLAKDLDAW